MGVGIIIDIGMEGSGIERGDRTEELILALLPNL